jgi:hypothetical protein
MNKQLDRNVKLDRIGAELMRQVHFEGRLDASTFLDQFHRKLNSTETELPEMSLGAWCWRMSPITCIGSLVLMIFFSVQGSMQPTAPDPTEQILNLLRADNGGVELIVEALFHFEGINQ